MTKNITGGRIPLEESTLSFLEMLDPDCFDTQSNWNKLKIQHKKYFYLTLIYSTSDIINFVLFCFVDYQPIYRVQRKSVLQPAIRASCS